MGKGDNLHSILSRVSAVPKSIADFFPIFLKFTPYTQHGFSAQTENSIFMYAIHISRHAADHLKKVNGLKILYS